MRRLFFVLDLSLLRQQADEQRDAALQQLITAVARLWAAYQCDRLGGGGGAAAAGRPSSWGYVLYDSACPDLLLKPKLRRIAQRLRKFGTLFAVPDACVCTCTKLSLAGSMSLLASLPAKPSLCMSRPPHSMQACQQPSRKQCRPIAAVQSLPILWL